MPRRRAILAGALLLLLAISVDAAGWEKPYFEEAINKHESVDWGNIGDPITGWAYIKEGTTTDAELMRLSLTDASLQPTVTYSGARGLEIKLEKDGEETPFHLVATEPGDYDDGTRSFRLMVAVQIDSKREVGYVYIELVNINDNPPVIRSLGDCSVKEEVEPLETDCEFHVSDRDGGACFVDMEVDDEHFSFKLTSPRTDGCQEATFVLVVVKKLDYEQYRLHSLKITAKDNGIINNNGDQIDGYQEGSASSVVNVIDIPDVEPVWEVIYPSHTVDEKQEWDLQLRAIDGDFGLNWPMRYSLECPELPEEECIYFHIDPDSGLLAGAWLDRDELKKEIFKIKVVATEVPDEDYPNFDALWKAHDIVIMVNDINDHSPKIEPETIIINHEEETHFYRMDWNVFDPDLAEHGTFNMWIEDDGKFSNNFLLIPNTGYQSSDISITALDPTKMDYEDPEWQIITLTIIAEELKDKSHVSRATITIELEDLNDEYPMFEEDEYIWNIEENQPLGYLVGQTIATDLDYGDVISYSITNNLMEIDEEGKITTKNDNAFDYERQTEIIFQVIAVDLEGHRNFTEVLIFVQDLNDEQPTLIMPFGREDIKEHEPVGTRASPDITATDPDTTADLIFEINPAESSAYKNGIEVSEKLMFLNSVRLVEIQKEDGVWKTHVVIADERKFDFEVFDTMKLQIEVIDLATDENYMDKDRSTAILTIMLGDTNDCYPQFTDESLQQVLQVTENTDKGRNLGSMIATDEDGPEYSQLKYYLEPVAPQQLVDERDSPRVTIEENTGRMFTTEIKIDCDKWQTVEFTYTVKVTDGDNWNQTQITFYIEDLNDELPEVIDLETKVIIVNDIKEETPGILDIACLAGNDIDYTKEFHTISYFIEGPLTNKFELDESVLPHERVCLTADGSQLNREDQEYYEIEILIRDNYFVKSKINSNEGESVIVKLTLIDINNCSPEFGNSGESITKLETDLKEESTIFTAMVTDDDIGENGIIFCDPKPTVEVVRSNHPQDVIETFFKVETNKDEKKDYYECSVKATKDFRDYWGEYVLTLTAHDKGEPSNNNTGTYPLIVTNVNRHEPKIMEPEEGAIIRIYRDHPLNSMLTPIDGDELPNFWAEDPDDPLTGNGRVTFELHDDQNQNVFTLYNLAEPNTVALQMVNRPVYGIRIFSLSLSAEDNGEPKLKNPNPVEFTVYVINRESAPEFSEEVEIVQFYENKTEVQQTTNISEAVNQDEILLERPRPVFYYIIEGNTSLFEMENKTRVLNLLDELDYETTPDHKHELTVLATHDEEPPTSTTGIDYGMSVLKIIVEILDVNDMPPEFSQSVYYGTFSVDHDIGKEIVILTAFDLDTEDTITYEMVQGTLTVDHDSLKDFESDNSFRVHPETGEVTLNFSPGNRNLQGAFSFRVVAYDSMGNVFGHNDFATVNVFVVSSDHQVEFLFYNPVNIVEDKKTEMAEVFSEVLKYSCTVEKVQRIESSENDVENSLVLTHFIDNANNRPVPAEDIQWEFMNTETYTKLYNAMQEHSLTFRGFSAIAPEKDSRSYMTIVLAAACAVLAVLVVVFSLAFVVRTRTLNQRLEKLTSKKFGSQDSGLNRDMAVPGTNQHALEGSNPVWNHDMGVNFDNMSQSSGDSDLVGIEDSPEFGGAGGVDNLTFEPSRHGAYGGFYEAPSLGAAAAAPVDAGPRRASINPLAAAAMGEGDAAFGALPEPGRLDLEDVGMPRRISLNPLAAAAAADDDFGSVDADTDVEGDAGSTPSSANFYFQQPKELSTEL